MKRIIVITCIFSGILLWNIPSAHAADLYEPFSAGYINMENNILPSEATYNNFFGAIQRAAGGNGNIDTGDDTGKDDDDQTRNDAPVGNGLYFLFASCLLYIFYKKTI